MKTFILSLAILVLLFTAVFQNSAYIVRFSDEISGLADEAGKAGLDADERREILEKTLRKIKDSSFALSLTVSHDEIESLIYRTEETLGHVRDDGEFYPSLDMLKRLSERLKRSEAFTLEGIF